MAVHVLKKLLVGQHIYQPGEVVLDPPPRLVELAGGELLFGQRVAEPVAQAPDPVSEPDAGAPEPDAGADPVEEPSDEYEPEPEPEPDERPKSKRK